MSEMIAIFMRSPEHWQHCQRKKSELDRPDYPSNAGTKHPGSHALLLLLARVRGITALFRD
jgi:hypothetical protein